MQVREKISFYLEDVESSIGKIINFFILGFILLSSAIFVLETYPLPEGIASILKIVDLVIVIIFAIEYLIRFWCAEKKISFLFSIFSIIDLLAIVPFLFGLIDVRFLRIFRWFRILRIIRFLDWEISIFRIQNEDGIILIKIFLTLFTIIFVYSGLIYQVEHRINSGNFQTFLDALYFSVVTMTTVGFGDITPISETGRLLTLLMILTGVTFIPWQVSDLVKQLLKTTSQVQTICPGCGLSFHDTDALFCKRCGTNLSKK